MARKKVFVFIDYDILIRHFVLNGTFREVEREHDVTYVFHQDSTSPKKGIYVDVDKLGLKRVLRCEVPRKRMGSWFKLFAVTVLHRQMGTANFAPRRERLASQVEGGWWRTWIMAFLALPLIYPVYRYFWLRKQGVWQPLEAFLRQHRPDIVLMPSLLAGYFINDLVIAARRQGIPTVVMMNSWDNPSQKAVVTAQPDRLVVWGEQTRRHAEEFMGVDPDRVEMFGAAQFQVYRRPVTEGDAELRAMFGVPPGLPIVLYGGVSKSVDESRHLKLIDDAIEDGRIEPCHVLYRPHPWRAHLTDGEKDFFALGLRHVTMDPHMADYYRRVANNPDPAMDMADYDVTRRLMALISCMVTSLSTLMLEVIMHGKPVLMFFPQRDMETKFGAFNMITLRLAHFQGFFESVGTNRCMEESDMPAAINDLLAQSRDPAVRQAVLEHARGYVVLDGPGYGERLASLVNAMTGNAPHEMLVQAAQ